MASAPSRAASRASSKSVIPQILTRVMRALELPPRDRLQHCSDEQNRARACRASFVNLKGLVYKVLTQHRKVRSFGNLSDPAEVALKKVLFGDDRHGAGSSIGVCLCLFCRIQICFEHTL